MKPWKPFGWALNAVTILGALALPASYIVRRYWPGNPFLGGFLLGLGGSILAFRLAVGIYLRWRPDKARQAEIEQNDERSQIVRGKAAQQSFLVSLLLLLALIIALLFMGLRAAAMLAVAALLLHAAVFLAAAWYYERKM